MQTYGVNVALNGINVNFVLSFTLFFRTVVGPIKRGTENRQQKGVAMNFEA